ncbi:tumor necrosis factor receptor superfamily member 13B [Rhinoraja longicauda]
MNSCSIDEFWDDLLQCCNKCAYCGRNWNCKSSCEIWKCNNAAGSYWDKLLRKCITCADVCGQHPQQCSEICNEIASSNQDAPVGVKNCLSHEDHFHILIFVFMAASLCIVTCLLLILVIYTVKKKNDTADSSHKTGLSLEDGANSSSDRLLQRGVEKDDQNQSISSDPSETCSYCFSEQRIGGKGRKLPTNVATSRQCIQQPPALDTRALPSETIPQHKPFQIICSPSQPSTKEIGSFLEKCHMKY